MFAADNPLQRLIALLAKLPGLGPRSARRVALSLMKKPETLLKPLAEAMLETARLMRQCDTCGNLDTQNPCAVCSDTRRDRSMVCVVEDVSDLWAMERSGIYRGLYHILGGTLSALDGIGPDQLRIAGLLQRVAVARDTAQPVREVILALNATLEGQTTAHVVAEQLEQAGITLTRLAHGLPIGGELDYLDDGTLIAAFHARAKAG
ncbi:MAG: recombination protein RecR [Alphaproteobacteria bacterium]|nr:recombination protein RecR [Alphaproteobacteria bacterium]